MKTKNETVSASEKTKTTRTKKAAKAAAEKVTEAAVEVAGKVSEAVSEAVEKAPETTAKLAQKTKKDLEKATELAAATAKKAPVRKAAVKETIYLQCYGEEASVTDLTAQVKAIWTEELGQKASALKTLTIYLKPEEGKAYYVMNDDVTGSISL